MVFTSQNFGMDGSYICDTSMGYLRVVPAMVSKLQMRSSGKSGRKLAYIACIPGQLHYLVNSLWPRVLVRTVYIPMNHPRFG